MALESYFFDSYALFEISAGNPAYQRFVRRVAIVTTRFNLIELHYGLLKAVGKDKAAEIFEDFRDYVVEINDGIIFEANEFRLANKKKNFSYVDCVGYIIAKRLGIPFLTGDQAFEGMDNVDFVK